jgi:hypothetical protein
VPSLKETVTKFQVTIAEDPVDHGFNLPKCELDVAFHF